MLFAPIASMLMHAAPDSYRADIPAEVNNFYDNTLLQRALPLNIHGLLAQRRNIPANFGSKIIKFRRYASLAVAGALTDGVTPTGKSLSVTDITATALQYGDFTRISDAVTTESPDPILTETSEILGEQMGLTNDELTRDVLVAGTVVQYASTAVSRVTVAAGMKLIVAEIDEAVLTLKLAKARRVTAISGASPGVGTMPIPSSFIGIIHPQTTFTIKGLTGYEEVQKYAPNAPTFPGEVGRIAEVRFIETTNAKIFTGAGAAGVDVYGTIILGADAYGIVDVAGSQNAGTIYKALGSAGSADPLNQRQTMGWKEYFVAKILNDAFMVRIEHAGA
jgi:N4-gp56 family major capsid protein